MRVRDNQRGATLLMVIGVIAALAVMAATLVLVIGNMQWNTADTRTRTAASGVGEAAMDGMMYQLALNWPKTSAIQPTLDATTIGSQFPASNFARPKSGAFVSAIYYDNSDTNGNGTVDRNDAHWDANSDDLMYVEAQGKVGDRATRYLALVERTFVDTSFPRGIALYDGGNMDANGGGNNPKVHIYNQGGLPGVSAYVNGTVPTGARDVFQNSISTYIAGDGQDVPSLDTLGFSSTLIQQVVAMAVGMGRYYDTTKGATMPTDLSGICVIRVADGTTVNLGGGINMSQGPHAVPASTDEPGILMILGPEPTSSTPAGTNTGAHIKIDMANNDRFYGVFYTDGQLDFAHGTPAFYGMAIFKSYVDMRGTADVYYDDSAITKLWDRWTLTVKLCPNTWREIHPL